MDNDKNIETEIAEQELTLVDIDELRETLGAEAELASSSSSAEAVSTIMCPQWY